MQDRGSAPHAEESYWSIFARSFHIIGPPFAPSPQDVRALESSVVEYARAHGGRALRVLLLGVTPRIAQMMLPSGSSLLGVDRTAAMVRHVFPADAPAHRHAVVGDWLCPPVADGSQDVILGDGAFNCVRYPHGLRQLIGSLRRSVRTDGTLMIRCFVQPVHPEDPHTVMTQIADSPSFHHFKMRLLMALQRNSNEGVAVNDVYPFWSAQRVDVAGLAARTGWAPQDIQTMELHKGPNVVHTFPSLQEIRDVLAPCFRTISIRVPEYYLGDRCPLLIARN